MYIHIYPTHNYFAIKKTSVPFPPWKRRIDSTRKRWKTVEDRGIAILKMGRDSLFQRSFQKRRRTHSTGRVCSREGEESGGKNEEGPDASMKSHVPSRVHRNAAGRLAVSGHARACWWSPVFSSAQVDATRAPHGRRARGTAVGRGRQARGGRR